MAFYRTGSVAVTQGGKTVTGTGTLWSVTVQPGDAFVVTDANGLAVGGIYEIASVNSNTSLTLYQNYQGTTAWGLAYAVLNMAGDQTTASFANRLSQFFDKQQAVLNAPGVNVIKVGGVTFSPDAVARMVEFVAGAGVTLTPSAAGKTVTIAGAQATESAIGSVALATSAEAIAGTVTDRAVTPAVSGSRITFATTSTDDATSATSAPLKSAGGLAVAKNIHAGGNAVIQGVGIGGAVISSTSPVQGETTITFYYSGYFSSKIEITAYANAATSSGVAEYLIAGTGSDDAQTTIKEVVKETSGFSLFPGSLTWLSTRTYTFKVKNTGFGDGRIIHVRVYGDQPTITFTHE